MKKKLISTFLMAAMLSSMMTPAVAVEGELPLENPPEESSLMDNTNLEDAVESTETEIFSENENNEDLETEKVEDQTAEDVKDTIDDAAPNNGENQTEVDDETPSSSVDDDVNIFPHEEELIEGADNEDTVSLLSDELIYGDLRYVVNNNTITITGCDTGATNISIPEQINGMNVSGIGQKAFRGHTALKTIDIPKTVKVIESQAFENCTSLVSVETHYNDTREWSGSIGTYAFKGCTSLANVNIAGSFKSWGACLFDGCSSLKSLIIPEGVTVLGYYMIKGTGISSITIPSTVISNSSYGYDGVLSGCITLDEVVFAQGMKKIPDYICATSDLRQYRTMRFA